MKSFDIAIVGGGLAGLTAGILAAKSGWRVVLIEKKSYPFHKVCGEYISLESEKILLHLGLPMQDWHLPRIEKFTLTATSGNRFDAKLPLGGIGISRFTLDNFLKGQLVAAGGVVLSPAKTTAIHRKSSDFQLETTDHSFPLISARAVLGSFGRNKPQFIPDSNSAEKSQTHLGVKFHVQADLPKDTIGLHHFPGGYCGISAVEDNLFCMCYLLKADFSKQMKGNLDVIEAELLGKNPFLKRYLSDFEKVTERVSTAGVFFAARPIVDDGLMFLGDAAGMIPPLAGNGMSMAIHSAVMAFGNVQQFLTGNKTLDQSCTQYELDWNKQFYHRLRSARVLQKVMEQPWMTESVLQGFQWFPMLFQSVSRATHGIQIPVPQSLKPRF